MIGAQAPDAITDAFVSGTDQIQLIGAAFGFGAIGPLVDGTNFFIVNNYDGTAGSFGGVAPAPGDAYVVFDPNSNTVYADNDIGAEGFTSVVTLQGGGAPIATDINIAPAA